MQKLTKIVIAAVMGAMLSTGAFAQNAKPAAAPKPAAAKKEKVVKTAQSEHVFIKNFEAGRMITVYDIMFLNYITDIKTAEAAHNKTITVGGKLITKGEKITAEQADAINAAKQQFKNSHHPEMVSDADKAASKYKNDVDAKKCSTYWFCDRFGKCYWACM